MWRACKADEKPNGVLSAVQPNVIARNCIDQKPYTPDRQHDSGCCRQVFEGGASVIVRDNQGNVVGEINTTYTNDGRMISTNTMFYNGRPVAQNISVRDSQGHVEAKNVLGNKILP
jgi:hypothetical protein